jgi:hypothetical protein
VLKILWQLTVLPTGGAWQRRSSRPGRRQPPSRHQTSMPGNAAWVYCILGNAYQKLGNISKAIEYHAQDLAIERGPAVAT